MMYGQWGFGDLHSFAIGPWIWPLLIWSLIWKGLALWRAGRRGEKGWFVVLLVVNTAGILEIVYLLLTNRKNKA